jgi:hypothetical protein
MMISFHDEALAACADIAAHAQRVETARSAELAAWQRQEDAAHTQALAEEADMRRRHDDNLRAVTAGFAIDFDILEVEVASWHDADDAMALLAMRRHKDDADAQGYHSKLAAATERALRKAAARANVLAASRRREDEALTKAFASVADKRNRRHAAIRAAQLKCVAQLGFMSLDEYVEYVAWTVECDGRHKSAERDTALAVMAMADEQRRQEEAVRAKALAVTAMANERHRQEEAMRAKAMAVTAMADAQRCQEEAVRAKALAAKADERRQRADITRAVARVTEPHRHAATERATALDAAPTMTPLAPPTAVLSFLPVLLHMWTRSYLL